MRFRIMIGVLAGLMLAYTVYWFVLADKAEDMIVRKIEAERQAGAAIAYDALDVGGFPYRLEFTAVNLDMSREEASGVSWRLTSPELIVVLQPWKLNHAIAFARTLTLELSEGDAPTALDVRDMRASVILDKARRPGRVAIEMAELVGLGPDLGNAPLKVADVGFHWRRPESLAAGDAEARAAMQAANPAGDPDEEPLMLEPLQSEWALRGARLTHPALAESPYGDTIETFDIVFAVHGDLAPMLKPQSLAEWRDAGGTLELNGYSMTWGSLDLLLKGSVSLDEYFRPLGAFTAEVRGYEPVIDQLKESGEIDPSEADTVKSTLGTIAGNDAQGRLTIPIALQSGRLFIGPLPVANLPSIVGE